MSILINGMEMPTGNNAVSIIIFPNGKVSLAHDHRFAEYAEAVPVPPHGDLIDRNALMDSDGDLWDGMWGWSGVKIMNAPTIIPAEEDER